MPPPPAMKPNGYPKAIQFALDMATGKSPYSYLIPVLLWLFDAVLTPLIIWKVPYTEIDWTAYMEQVSQFVSGERDYTKMAGGTGPLVYPAAHVYTYTALYHLTDQGRDIVRAQFIFAAIYLAALAVVMRCYWNAGVPPIAFPALVLSRRLHSVFVLRCFNDGIAALFLFMVVALLQRRSWTLASMLYTWGLGVKMSLLLVLPALAIILMLGRGFRGALRLASLMLQVQVLISLPFTSVNGWGYLSRAFELSRQFMYKWTVNWRMVGEEVFLSKWFAITLLAGHATILSIFIIGRYLSPSGRTLPSLIRPILRLQSPFTQAEELRISRNVTPEFVMSTMLSANVIGLLFARSLHYQFYAYLAWTTPYLIWSSSQSLVLVYGIWAVQEWAWNVYPSSNLSSMTAVGVMALTVVATYFGGWEHLQSRAASAAEVKKDK